jgi:hypothetical protein
MKLLNTALAAVVCLVFAGSAMGQTFTSSADGTFTTNANWSGGTAPPLSGQSYGSVTVQNNMNTGAAYTVGSFALSVSAGKTLTVNGNLTLSNSGGTIDVYGTLIVTGTFTASANANSFFIHPGGYVIIQGAATINNNGVIKVGTNATPPPYADLVFESNVNFASGGAGLTVNQNGRVAVYGNVTSTSGGGQVLTVNNGGQMYVNGNIALTGNGDQIVNNNSTNPFGLYVNGTTTNTGGGAGTTANEGNKAAMLSGDPSFYAWVAAQPSSPLPITLLEFKISSVGKNSVQVSWVTANELNLNSFELEKSVDGKDFVKIGTVPGNGTTSEQHRYGFADENPVIGYNFYRLKSIDFDGYTQIFDAIVADFTATRSASIYPNPLSDSNLHVDLNFEGNGSTLITITDTFGNPRLSATSTETLSLVPVTLEPGVYLVTIVNGSFKQVSRLSVSH